MACMRGRYPHLLPATTDPPQLPVYEDELMILGPSDVSVSLDFVFLH
jgi:hypothetical protein